MPRVPEEVYTTTSHESYVYASSVHVIHVIYGIDVIFIQQVISRVYTWVNEITSARHVIGDFPRLRIALLTS